MLFSLRAAQRIGSGASRHARARPPFCRKIGRANISGVGWSDQWAFWQQGYPGIMITNTAPFRDPHYHAPTDTPDKLDYDRFALVVSGVEKTIEELASNTRSVTQAFCLTCRAGF